MSLARCLSWRCSWTIAAVCAAASAAPGYAQRVISGIVVDMRERPVAFVAVAAVGGASAVTDDNRLVFDVRRIGFMPSRISLEPGGDTSFSILLLPSTQRLEGVEVTSIAGKPPALAGFEERMAARKRAAGAGLFITAQDIESRPATRTSQVVENLPSIYVRRIGGDRYAIYGRGVGGVEALASTSVALRWIASSCSACVYLPCSAAMVSACAIGEVARRTAMRAARSTSLCLRPRLPVWRSTRAA